MSIRIAEERTIPAEACVFTATAVLAGCFAEDDVEEEDDDADSMADDSDDDDEEDGDDAEAAEGDAEDEDAEAAEDDDEDDDAEVKDGGEAKASDGRAFTVIANSGKPMRNVPFWGTLAIDLAGVRGKRRVPALMDHDVQQRVGVFEKRRITKRGLEMQGTFLQRSELASRVNAELRDGFPYESSVRLQPTRIEEIAAGETAEVNGHRLEGPAFIFRQSELRETSLVTLGQDPHTAAAALASAGAVTATFTTTEPREAKPMKTKTEPSAREVANEAVAAERSRIAQLTKAALPEQSELLAELIAEGVDYAAGIAKLHADLTVRLKARRDERHRLGNAALSIGNSGQEKRLTALERVRAMPDSPQKWKKLYELDTELQAEFESAEEYAVFESFERRYASKS